MFDRIFGDIMDIIGDSNVAPIDTVIQNGSYRALIHFQRSTVAGWNTPASSLIVPEGKKAVVVYCLPSANLQDDPGSRRMRLMDSLSGAVIALEGNFKHGGIPGFGSGPGDQTADSDGVAPLPEASAGLELRLEIWNGDGNSRAMGGAVILKIVSA